MSRVSIRRRPWARRIDQRRLGTAFGLRGFGAHFLASRSKLSRMRPIGVSRDGLREVLGLWVADNEGAKFWLSVMTELKNRVLIVTEN